MGYRVSGILKLPDGTPANNAEIEFISRKNFSPLVQELKSNIKCSATGAYDVTLEYGEYAVIIYPGGTYPAALGTIILAADTVVGQDLPTLLQQEGWQPATPEYVQQIQAWLSQADRYAQDAKQSADDAASTLSSTVKKDALTSLGGELDPAAAWSGVPAHSDDEIGDPMNAQAEALAARTKLLRTEVMEALRRSYAEAGYNVVGTFQAGFTIVNVNDVGIDLATGKGFTGSAGFVAAGTNPTSGEFVDRSGDLLRITYFSGPVRSLSQSQFSLAATMTPATQTSRVQGFIDSFILFGGCAVIDQSILVDDTGLNARSNMDILFTNGAALTKDPTAAPGYNLIRFDNVKNSHVYAPILIGDKYHHLADTGEWGAGIAIVGECDNLHIHQPVCSSMWGDGILVSKDTSDKYPLGVHIYQPKCDKNRRQGISIEGGVARIYEPELTNTKSSDSRFTLANGPHAGIDIEPFDNTPVSLDVLVTSPKTSGNDGAGVMVSPFYLTTAKTLRIDVQNHVDEGSKEAFFLLGDNANFSGYIKYAGTGTLNKQNALHISAWKRSPNCLVDIDITAKLWGVTRAPADVKYGAAWAWDVVNGIGQGGVNLKVRAIGPSHNGSSRISYCIGSEYNDIDVQFTAGTTDNILACPNSNVRVKCLAANPPAYSGFADYTKLLTEFYINGTGDKKFAFESSYLGNIADGTEITLTARNVTSLAIVRSASQASVGGYVYAPDGTKNGWKVTGNFLTFNLVKYGNDVSITSVSGSGGTYA